MRLATLHHRVRRARCAGSVSIMILLLVLGLMSRPAKAEEPVVATLPGKPFLYFGNYEPASVGYTLSEFTVSGQARAYAKGVNAESTGIPMGKTPYKTRVVVMRPNDPTKFNGSVIVEWMNVTGGLDVPVEWITAYREFIRRGYAYVGVTAQKVGIDGGKARSEGISASLKTVDPKRYGSLLHPGDAYAFDMFSDVGRLLRSQHASTLLGPLATKRILAVGESQSAFFLTTYANSVDPIAAVYDGFLIHSRSGAAVGLDGRSLFDHGEAGMMTPVRLRRDLRVPVLQLITETDLLRLGNSIGFHAARQPDTKRLRTWEIAGAAHADNYLIAAGMSDVPDQSIGALAKAMAPRLAMGTTSGPPMNNGPQQHYVTQAAIRQLDRWVETGVRPAKAARLRLKAGNSLKLAKDGNGNALGGVRTPWVDAPLSRLTGDPSISSTELFGATFPLRRGQLDKLYPLGKLQYLDEVGVSLDAAMRKGFILKDDHAEIVYLSLQTYDDTRDW